MPGLIGEPRYWHDRFKFRLEIDDVGSAAFQNCSELSVEINEIEYYEGGTLVPFKEPGRMKFSDLTIERAATTDADLYAWLQITADAAQNSGLITPKFKRGGQVVQLDRDNERIRIWRLHGLWPKKFTAGSWDNNSDEFTMEQCVLCFDYFHLTRNTKSTKTQNLADLLRKAASGNL